jgi:hypothetical protein
LEEGGILITGKNIPQRRSDAAGEEFSVFAGNGDQAQGGGVVRGAVEFGAKIIPLQRLDL